MISNMRKKTLYDIVIHATEIKMKVDKAEWLKSHDSQALRNVLAVMYNPALELRIPNELPDFRENKNMENHNFLLREARKLKYIVKGYSDDQLSQFQVEKIFIDMLETVHPDDAKLLGMMIAQKPLKGLTVKTLNMAFGVNFIPTSEDEND